MPILGDLFAAFRDRIGELPTSAPIRDEQMLSDSFLLEREGDLEIFYAPVDWLRPRARLAIVGITPGKETMRIALQTASREVNEGRSDEEVLQKVKQMAPFSGFRAQLIEWLIWLGLAEHLDVSRENFWDEVSRVMHATSCVRYPVFVRGKNYSGGQPRLDRSPTLRRYITGLLGPELSLIPDALVVPLGEKAGDALRLLASEGSINLERCLLGFPHPSGANGHRMRIWAENRDAMKSKVTRFFELPNVTS